MKKSFYLDLSEYFESVPSLDHLARVHYSRQIRHAQASFWKRREAEAILQEFDGYRGYLYQFDVVLDDSITIPIRIDLPDMHLLYLIQGSYMLLLDQHGNHISDIHVRRARYLYLPPGVYTLHFPKGKTELFGCYFDGGLFRDGNERKFHFLHPLIQAYREQRAEPVCSIDFPIGPRTLTHIHYFCDNLRKGNFSNESFVMQELTQLVELSREKVLQEESKIQYAQHVAEQAQKLITLYIEQEGQYAKLKQLEKDIALGLPTINRLHKQHFGKTLQTLREEILLEKAIDLLRSGMPATQCAYALNYLSPEAFFHFFKKKTGTSPGKYLKERSDTKGRPH